MSHPTNTKWIEDNYEHFLESVSVGDWQTAEACIEDAKEYGFDEEAAQMRQKLTHERFEDQ